MGAQVTLVEARSNPSKWTLSFETSEETEQTARDAFIPLLVRNVSVRPYGVQEMERKEERIGVP